MKLLTISDGFGDSGAVPNWHGKFWKWPKIIEMMTKGLTVINCSRYGAGNEFIVANLREYIDQADKVIIQWVRTNRLDLILSNSNSKFWDDVIASDPMYKDNVVACGANNFWLSSGSTAQAVQKYHQQYASVEQHQLRSQIYVEYAKLLLESQGIDYRFMLTDNSEYLNVNAKWICHEPMKGMHEFRKISKYRDVDLGFVQPTPLIAFDFIKQYVMPSIDLQWRNSRDIDAVENILHKHYKEALANKNDSH